MSHWNVQQFNSLPDLNDSGPLFYDRSIYRSIYFQVGYSITNIRNLKSYVPLAFEMLAEVCAIRVLSMSCECC